MLTRKMPSEKTVREALVIGAFVLAIKLHSLSLPIVMAAGFQSLYRIVQFFRPYPCARNTYHLVLAACNAVGGFAAYHYALHGSPASPNPTRLELIGFVTSIVLLIIGAVMEKKNKPQPTQPLPQN